MTQELPGVVVLDVVRQYGGEVELSGETLIVQTPVKQWSYAIGLPVRHEMVSLPEDLDAPALFRLQIQVYEGKLGIACADPGLQGFLDQTTVEPAPEPVTVDLTAFNLRQCNSLIFRNDGDTGRPTIAAISSAQAFRLAPFADRRLHVLFDLNVLPIGIDFASLVMGAEIERARLGLESLHVILAPNEAKARDASDAEKGDTVDAFSWRRGMSNHLLQLLSFFPSASNVTFAASHTEAVGMMTGLAHVYPDCKETGLCDVPALSRNLLKNLNGVRLPAAPEQARRYVRQWLERHCPAERKWIAITLRDADCLDRDDNLKTWAAFAERLDKSIYAPFFIPDTGTALLGPPPSLQAFSWFSEAAITAGLHFAANEMAYLNLMPMGGPSAICSFNPAVRFLCFGHDPDCGDPFVGLFQKRICESAGLEVIESEFHAMAGLIDAACN